MSESQPDVDAWHLDLDVDGLSVRELAMLVRGHVATAKVMIALAGDDPARARKMLDVESTATGGDPRREVVRGLEAITNERTTDD